MCVLLAATRSETIPERQHGCQLENMRTARQFTVVCSKTFTETRISSTGGDPTQEVAC